LGYIVGFSFPKEDKGYIVDLLVDPNRQDVIQKLISNIVEEFRKKEVNQIICHISESSPYYKTFQVTGFTQSSKKYVQSVAIWAPSKIPIETVELIKNPENWHLTLGDEDGVLVASNPFKFSLKAIKPGYYYIRERLKRAIRRIR
jgi:hypothetical protein